MRIQFFKNCGSSRIYLFIVELSGISPMSKITCVCCAGLGSFSISSVSEATIEKELTKKKKTEK